MPLNEFRKLYAKVWDDMELGNSFSTPEAQDIKEYIERVFAEWRAVSATEPGRQREADARFVRNLMKSTSNTVAKQCYEYAADLLSKNTLVGVSDGGADNA